MRLVTGWLDSDYLWYYWFLLTNDKQHREIAPWTGSDETKQDGMGQGNEGFAFDIGLDWYSTP